MTSSASPFARVLREQTPHPIYPKIGLELSDAPGMVRVTLGDKSLDMPAAQAQAMLEGREKSIALEAADLADRAEELARVHGDNRALARTVLALRDHLRRVMGEPLREVISNG